MVKARTKKRAGRQAPPAEETKRERFLRIATPRMQRALTSIRLLGNLSSPNYGWDAQDVEMMRSQLTQVLNDTLQRFEKEKRREAVFEGFEVKEHA